MFYNYITYKKILYHKLRSTKKKKKISSGEGARGIVDNNN
jgi:hypothetical protein